jgi:hypothetical protein
VLALLRRGECSIIRDVVSFARKTLSSEVLIFFEDNIQKTCGSILQPQIEHMKVRAA